MRITIIPEDKRIIVDKKTVDLDDDDIRWEFDDSHIHAIQWKDGRGELEYEDVIGEKPVPNKIFGEDEFETIIKPYLEFYTEFLNAYEQKELEEALLEEERIAAEQEEIIVDKLEKDSQIAFIEDLQKQNKEVRERNEELNDEIAKFLEKSNYDQRTSEIEQRRKELEYLEEISTAKTMKSEEYIQKINKDMQKKFDDLLEQFEKEKEAFIEERKMYNELLEKERDQISAEYDAVQAQIKREDEEREEEKRISQAWEELEQESIQQTRIEMELQTRNMEETVKQLEYEIAEVRKERDNTLRRLDREQEEFEIVKDQQLQELAKEKEFVEQDLIAMELNRDINDDNKFHDMFLPDILDDEYKELQNYKVKSVESMAESVEDFAEDLDFFTQREDSKKEHNINDIIQMMTDIDPEQLYTTLTDEEKEENYFPVDKAVQWFEKLKEVLDKENRED